MSYVLCGDFFLNKIKRDKVSAVKAKAEELDACFWLKPEFSQNYSIQTRASH